MPFLLPKVTLQYLRPINDVEVLMTSPKQINLIAALIFILSCQPRTKTNQPQPPQTLKITTGLAYELPAWPIAVQVQSSYKSDWSEIYSCSKDNHCRSFTSSFPKTLIYGMEEGKVLIHVRSCSEQQGCGPWKIVSIFQKYPSSRMENISREIAETEDLQITLADDLSQTWINSIKPELERALPIKPVLSEMLKLSSNFSFQNNTLNLTNRNSSSPRVQDPVLTPRTHQERTTQIMNSPLKTAGLISAGSWAIGFSHLPGLGRLRNKAGEIVANQQPIKNQEFKEPIEKFLKKWTIHILEHKIPHNEFEQDIAKLMADLGSGPIQKVVSSAFKDGTVLKPLMSKALSEEEYYQDVKAFLQTPYNPEDSEQTTAQAEAFIRDISQNLIEEVTRLIKWPNVSIRDNFLKKFKFQFRKVIVSLVEIQRLHSIEASPDRIEEIQKISIDNITELASQVFVDLGSLHLAQHDYFRNSDSLRKHFYESAPAIIRDNFFNRQTFPDEYQKRRHKLQITNKSLHNIKKLTSDVISELSNETLRNIGTGFIPERIYDLQPKFFRTYTIKILDSIIQNALLNVIVTNEHRVKVVKEYEEIHGEPPSKNSLLWTSPLPGSYDRHKLPQWLRETSWISTQIGSRVEQSVFKSIDKSLPIDEVYSIFYNKRTAPAFMKSVSQNVVKSLLTVYIDPKKEVMNSTQTLIEKSWLRAIQVLSGLTIGTSIFALAIIPAIFIDDSVVKAVTKDAKSGDRLSSIQLAYLQQTDTLLQKLHSLHFMSYLENIRVGEE